MSIAIRVSLPTLLVTGISVAAAAQSQPPAGAPSPTKPDSFAMAVGTIRSIVSAQAHHKKTKPEAGFACSLQELVDVKALGDVVTRKPFNGYVFTVNCPAPKKPQDTFRAFAAPADGTAGENLCTDQTFVVHVGGTDLASCLAKGRTLK